MVEKESPVFAERFDQRTIRPTYMSKPLYSKKSTLHFLKSAT